jgi:hypothetical protein
MISCPECEDGRCPCGGGCPACCFTGECSECTGTMRTINRAAFPTQRSATVRIKETT